LERNTVVGGLPAAEYHYRGKADDHDWPGKLVVVARGKDMFTVLAMIYADSDLIQIQENVIARAIASLDTNSQPSRRLDFNAHLRSANGIWFPVMGLW
jgi:hypothetical protein